LSCKFQLKIRSELTSKREVLEKYVWSFVKFHPLNAKLNPICHLLALLRAHPILHISRIRVKNV
jgi:hypothetical protein